MRRRSELVGRRAASAVSTVAGPLGRFGLIVESERGGGDILFDDLVIRAPNRPAGGVERPLNRPFRTCPGAWHRGAVGMRRPGRAAVGARDRGRGRIGARCK